MHVENKVLRFILFTAIPLAIILLIRFIASLITKQPFDPRWGYTIGISCIGGVCSLFAPDSEQQKKNRENLKDEFTHNKEQEQDKDKN